MAEINEKEDRKIIEKGNESKVGSPKTLTKLTIL